MKHQRRANDKPMSTGQKVWTGSAAGALFVGFATFIYRLTEMLNQHTDWSALRTPPGVAEVLSVFLAGLIAMGGALFTDFSKLWSIITRRS